MVIKIDASTCCGCSYCFLVCPKDALLIRETVHVNVEKCTDCKLCINVCPTSSIMGWR